MTMCINLDDGLCVHIDRYRESPAPRPTCEADWHDSLGWIVCKGMKWIECVTNTGRPAYIQVAHITSMREVD